MLQWLCEQFMDVEVSAKIKASKSEQKGLREGYRSGFRVRRFDTRMGTMYLFVPELRKGGYIPFLVTVKSRQKRYINVIKGSIHQWCIDSENQTAYPKSRD